MDTPLKNVLIVIGIAVLAVLIGSTAFKLLPAASISSNGPTVDADSGNHGLFIDNLDSGYFSTTDPNVKKIVLAYLTNQDAKTDSDKYGNSLVFYYTKDAFIREELFSAADRNSVSSFTMYDMKTGQPISDCVIYAQAGLYEDGDLLLSASFTDDAASPKSGACLYQRGEPNFTFIDLTSKLSSTETLFSDPTGRNLKASIKNIDTQDETFTVDVYDTAKKDASGNYAYKRDLGVAY